MTAGFPFPTVEPSLLEQRVWDVAVVGAGPAGAMVAHELAREGCSVVLLDRREFPRWKVCGACLSPGAQAALQGAGLGDIPSALGALPLELLRLRGWSVQADISLKGSLAVSRAALDHALVSAATARGAVFSPLSRIRFEAVSGEMAHLTVDLSGGVARLRARLVVAADGLGSKTLAQSSDGAEPSPTAPSDKLGLGAVFEGEHPGFAQGVIHMALGEDGYAGLVRTECGRLNVAAAVNRSALGRGRSPGKVVAHLLREASFPPLQARPVEGWKGTPSLTHNPERLGGKRVFAVGDAAGYVEPFTGEGMSWALSGARTLAPIARRALQGWTNDFLREWEESYRRTVGRAQRVCRLIAWALDRPRLSRATLRLLDHFPLVADPFVAKAASPPPSVLESTT
jgi:flavin-dependent dehydrogenase